MGDIFGAFGQETTKSNVSVSSKIDLLERIISIEDCNNEKYKCGKITFSVYAERDRMIKNLKREFYSL